jgi:hypothetical protein
MPKKIQALADWISAHDAAQILSLNHGRPIQPYRVRQLAKAKRQPIKTMPLGNGRKLYSRADIEQVSIRERSVIPRLTTGQSDDA